MARRKKEPEGFHREQIAKTAEVLFRSNGILHTTMDDIAKTSGYSKATLYAYYRNKEEIVSTLVNSSMKLLLEHIDKAVGTSKTTKEKYRDICLELVCYQEEYPFYFEMVLGEINIDPDSPDYLPSDRDTYETGELINEKIAAFLQEGIERRQLRNEIPVISTVFAFWSGLSGMILTAAKKHEYIETVLGQTKEAFLSYGFDLLYRSIENTGMYNEKEAAEQ